MAFVGWGSDEGNGSKWRIGGREVRDVVEGFLRKVWSEVEGTEIKGNHLGTFRVMTYSEAMRRVSFNAFHADLHELNTPLN
jgi:hypothetical protein